MLQMFPEGIGLRQALALRPEACAKCARLGADNHRPTLAKIISVIHFFICVFDFLGARKFRNRIFYSHRPFLNCPPIENCNYY